MAVWPHGCYPLTFSVFVRLLILLLRRVRSRLARLRWLPQLSYVFVFVFHVTIQHNTIRYNTIQYVLPATASSSSSIHCVRAERWWWIFCQRRHLSQLCCWSVTVLSLLVVLTIDDRHSLFSPFYLCTCTCRPNHGCANRGCDHRSKYWLFQRPLVHPVRTCQLLSDQRLHWYVSS